MRTQMFTRFIEERSFVADGDMGLAFFDECTERLTSEESNIRLLEGETTHNSERTVLLLPLEPHTPGIHFIMILNTYLFLLLFQTELAFIIL